MAAAEKSPNAATGVASGKGASAKLADCLKPFDPSKREPNASGWAHWFVTKKQSGGLNVKLSHVDKAQATHGAHVHAEDEVFYILEGTVVFEMNGEIATAGPGTALYCPGGSRHGIRRAGETPIKYLVIKAN